MRAVEILKHVVISKPPAYQHELHASRRDDAAAMRPLELRILSSPAVVRPSSQICTVS